VAHLLSDTSDKISEQLVRAMRGGSTRVIFTLLHRDLDSRRRDDAQPERLDDAQLDSRRRDDAQPDSRHRDDEQLYSRHRDHARLDHAKFYDATLDDTASINEDHRAGIFVDLTSLKCYVYNPLGKEHSSTAWAIEQAQAALHKASDSTFKVKYMEFASDQMMVNPCDCGIFLIAAASNWLRGLSMPLERDMAAYRLKLITTFADNHEKAVTAPPTTPIDNIDDNEVVFLGQTTARESTQAPSNPHPTEEEGRFLPANLTSALVSRSSPWKPKEKCTRCKRTGDMCDFNSPCASCSSAGVSDQCYHISDHDRTVLRGLQQQFGAPCVACSTRDFCDRESPCRCCDYLGLECEYHPSCGKKANLDSYTSSGPDFIVDPRAMGFSTPQAGTSERDTQSLPCPAKRQRTSGSASRGDGNMNIESRLDLA